MIKNRYHEPREHTKSADKKIAKLLDRCGLGVAFVALIALGLYPLNPWMMLVSFLMIILTAMLMGAAWMMRL